MTGGAQRRTGEAAVLMLALVGSLAGCASFSGGHSGTCRYGLRNQQGGSTCYSRPKPKGAAIAEAMSGQPLVRGLAAWKHAHGARFVSSVGVNQWGETTFSSPTGATGFGAPRHRLGTFNARGRLVKGDAGYASDPGGAGFGSNPEDPVPVSAVRPQVLTRLIRTIRAGQPDTHLLQAVLDLDSHTGRLAWHVEVVTPGAGSALTYYAGADGRELCHERDNVPDDALVPTRGVPTCSFFVTVRSLEFDNPDKKLLNGVTRQHGRGRLVRRRPHGIPPSAARRLECVKKAGGNVAKLVRCGP